MIAAQGLDTQRGKIKERFECQITLCNANRSVVDCDQDVSISHCVRTIMKSCLLLLLVCMFSLPPVFCADLIVYNGKIVSVDSAFRIYSAMAVEDGRIIALGSDEDVLRHQTNRTKQVDLKGKTVLPGLIDSHGHPASASVFEFDHTVPEMDSIADILEYIRARASVVQPGEWIWVNQIFLTRLQEERYPTRAELDSAAPEHPVVFRTGPDASINSMALELCGIDSDWQVDDGGPGYAEKDKDTGEPTGILRGCTRYLPRAKLKQPTSQQHQQALQKLFTDYNRVGIVGVTERAADEEEIALYSRMREEDALSVRMYLSRHVNPADSIDEIERVIQSIRSSEYYDGDELLSSCAAKTFSDGGMLTGSAFMREPWGVSEMYNISDPDYRGTQYIAPDKLKEIISVCMKHDVQFTSHCVGDGAVHAFLDACKALNSEHDVREQRPVICHSNFMSAEAVRLCAELGVTVDIQPAWLYLDARTLMNQFGYERLSWFQPLKALFDAGAVAGGGSDHMLKLGSTRSINFYDPWLGMYTAMTRKAKWLDRPLHDEHALSRVEALRFYTINNAYILQCEDQRGSLEAGKLADFIVIDRDFLLCPIEEIKDIVVQQTWLGGEMVYSAS